MSWLIGFLTASAFLNALLIWYIVQLLKRYLTFQDRLDSFVDKVDEYKGHVDLVYNLETFYGDETLGNLLKHSKNLVEDCSDFKLLYLGEENIQEIEEYEEEEIDAS